MAGGAASCCVGGGRGQAAPRQPLLLALGIGGGGSAAVAAAVTYAALGIAGASLALLVPWLRRRHRRAEILQEASAAAAAEVANCLWDFIVVGGGTAGCLLANRLTAGGASRRVLVLEAGEADFANRRIRIPAGVLDLFQTKYDWNFRTEDPKIASGRGVYLCRGRVLGGSSSLNVMLYTRGDAKDYDLWEAEFGCKGWSAEEVLPYFRRTQDDRLGLARLDPKHHSCGGEWSVDAVRYQNELSACFLRACSEAGLPENPDFNCWDRPQEGSGRFPVSQRCGSRLSSASALLAPALLGAGGAGGACGAAAGQAVRRRLKVLTNAHVRHVVFNTSSGGVEAQGVEFSVGSAAGGGGPSSSHVARLAEGGEVVLAAGALHSPHILQLSGVGPREHLEANGVPVVADLPGVGENLQDHPAANLSFECDASKKGISPTSHCMFVFGRKIPHPLWIARWLLLRSGPLTSPGCDHGAFVRTAAAVGASPSAAAVASASAERPQSDVQLRFLPARAVSPDGMNSFASFRHQRGALPDGFSFQSVAIRPHSRGRVRLGSSDPRQPPVVEGGHLADARDVASLREGLRLSRRLAEQPAFAGFVGREVFPGPAVQSDEELDAYILETVHSANALVGTCRMGRVDDPQAVCDPEMRVRGVRRLRVCDASVMPKLPGGQAGAATVMLAERGAELLLGGRP